MGLVFNQFPNIGHGCVLDSVHELDIEKILQLCM